MNRSLADIWPQSNIVYSDLYFPILALYLEKCFTYKHHTFRLWAEVWPLLKINVGHSDLYFSVQWFYLISWRIFNVWTYFAIMSQYDPKFDFKINVGQSDLFMVRWYCLMIWGVFMYKHHSLWLLVTMTRSLKYVTSFPMYYTHMTLPNAGVTLTSVVFLYYFIGKLQFGQLCCPATARIC